MTNQQAQYLIALGGVCAAVRALDQSMRAAEVLSAKLAPHEEKQLAACIQATVRGLEDGLRAMAIRSQAARDLLAASLALRPRKMSIDGKDVEVYVLEVP